MICYHKNNEIDRERWDICVKNSPGVKPYAYSWYLDLVSPGWVALVDDDYDSVFPIPGFNKFGIQYVSTPIFLQQLGAFSPDRPASEKILEFIEYLPDIYKLIDLCIGQRINVDGFHITEKANFELDLSLPYDKIWEGFSSDCRRNIGISDSKKPKLVSDITPDEIIDLFIRNKGMDIKGIKARDYQRLKNLMNFCIKNKKGRIIGVRTLKKRLVFAIFIIETIGNITLLFAVNSLQSREERTHYFVVNELIKEYSSTKTILDFEGSSIPSIASFMKSFGSENVPYYRIYRNRLLWPVRLLK